jgi:HAD superfamily hydrolase (TIGR01509 family)
MKLSAIFFDVGNTLVLPDLSRTLAPLHEQGVRPTAEQLNAAERAAKTELDSRQPTHFKSTDQQYWDTYYSFLLRELRTADPEVKAKLIKEARTSANWDVVQAGTRELLEDLQHRFRLGVISNSDGRVAQLLERCGVSGYFAGFTDSGQVGHEKPHPAIFRHALEQLRVAPGHSLYVGDIYSVDYAGAVNAGMQAVLFDPSGTYKDLHFARIESLTALPAHIANLQTL